MKETSLSTVVSLEFDKVYPNEPRPEYKTLLAGIPTSAIMEIVGHFTAMLYTKEIDQKLQTEILTTWLKRLPESVAKSVYSNVMTILNGNSYFSFFSNQSSLLLIERVLVNFTAGESRNLTPEEEERLFKAYLIASQEWIDNQSRYFKPLNSNAPEDIVKFALPMIIPHDDLKKFRDFRWQIFKGISFFKFTEKNEELVKHLPEFLKQYGIETWDKYMYHVIGGIVNLFSAGHKSILLTNNDDPVNLILDELSISVLNYNPKLDFIGLREKPVYKISEGKYLLYNYSLFIDKIFQAMQFDFGKFLQGKGVVKNMPNFKSKFISKDFSEQYLFYDLIAYIINGRKKAVSFNGVEWEAITGEEGPDYYIRCGNKIFLLEFKDALFQAEAKLSHDAEKILVELRKKLVENERGKPKGVSQLANHVNIISDKGLDFDKFNPSEITIYPVLVTTDEAFNSFGINYLLKKEYSSLLNDNALRRSREIALIHIDTFIQLQDLLHNKQVPIQDCLQWYFDYVNKPKSPFDPFLSFSAFITGELERRGLKYNATPRRMQKLLPEMFPA